MRITANMFEAYLKCPKKCWLRTTGERFSGNAYAEWVKTQDDFYRATETERLVAQLPNDEIAFSPPTGNVRPATGWGLHPLEKRRLVTAHVESGLRALKPIDIILLPRLVTALLSAVEPKGPSRKVRSPYSCSLLRLCVLTRLDVQGSETQRR
jgi:hypothetical protein